MIAKCLPLIAAAVAIASCANRPRAADDYLARVSLPLTLGPDRLDGHLELLEDARIRPEMRSAIAEAHGDDPCLDDPPAVLRPLCGAADRRQLRRALLRLVDARGHVIASHTAERPLAELSTMRLYASKRRTYPFTVDLSAAFGSYSGPYTRLAEPDANGFGWLTADSARDSRDTITLVSTLKTAWRAEPRAGGQGQDLLMVLCRPDYDRANTNSFLLTFKRYTFDGHRWLLLQRQERGFWESDDDFPAASRFP